MSTGVKKNNNNNPFISCRHTRQSQSIIQLPRRTSLNSTTQVTNYIWDSELSSKLLIPFGSVSVALLQSTCKSCALKWTTSVLVPDYGLRHLAASSYQECTQCASEMTYIVSSGALNSTPTNQANVCCITELCLQWAGSVEQSVSNTARQWCVTTDIQAATLQHDEHHPALLRRFCEAPLYKTLDLLTCLLLASWGSRIVILGDPSLPVRSRPSILLVATASVKPRTMCSH